eukprot:scaffold285318_cov19-Tisochrysis_lutea.AAC.1
MHEIQCVSSTVVAYELHADGVCALRSEQKSSNGTACQMLLQIKEQVPARSKSKYIELPPI